MRITYIGDATLLLEAAGVRILTDPNFDPRLAGVLPRVSAPGIPLRELPELDAIVVTHAHADHLSFASLDALPIAPGSTMQVGELLVTAAAAKHLGNRYAVDRWRSAANMYLLRGEALSCFFAGDTALTPDSHRVVADHLHARGRRLDVALLPIGHAPWWKPRYRSGHMTYEDALVLWERLGARYFIPYHWGTFRHVTSGPYDAIDRLRGRLAAHHRREDVKILEPGEAFEVELATT